MLRLTLGQARRSIGRLTAAGIAIAIGTAFVAATLLTVNLVTQTTHAAVVASLAQADLVVTGAAIEQDVVDLVAEVPGVAAVEAPLQGFLELHAGGRIAFQPWTVVAGDQRLQPLDVVDGALPSAGELAVPRPTADRLGIEVGDTVRATFWAWDEASGSTVDRHESLVVAGIVSDPGGAFLVTDGALLVTAADGQRWTAAQGEPAAASRLLVALDGGADVREVRGAVAGAVRGHDLVVRTRAEQATWQLEETAGASNVLTGLVLGFAAIALIVAALVIANTFNVLVAQRTRQLALLRCVGASTRQLRRSVRFEALLLGLAASVTGIVAGIALGQTVLTILRRSVTDVPLPAAVGVRPAVVVVPLIAGVVVTLVAATAPARAAARVSPLAAMRPTEAPVLGAAASRNRLRLAVLCTVGGLALLGVGMVASRQLVLLGLAIGIAGGLASFVGVLVGAVFWVPRLLGMAGGLLARRGHAPAAELAAANTVRNPHRTAATSAALLIGVTLVAMMTTGAESARASLSSELDRQYPVDLTIRTLDATDGRMTATDVAAVGAIDGVAAVTGLRSAEVLLAAPGATDDGGAWATAFGLDPADTGVTRGGHADGLAPGTVLVPASLAEPAGVADGDVVALTAGAPDGSPDPAARSTRTARVRDLPGNQLLVTPADLEALAPDATVSTLWVRLADTSRAAPLTADVQELFQTRPVDIGGPALERAQFDRVIDTLLAVVVGLLGVAVVIALVGVANTLSLSVIERRHESATLRAIGLTRRQLRQTLSIEGVLIAGVGAVLGTGLGMLYGWAGARTLLAPLASDLTLAVPWTRLAVVLVVALAAGLLASVLPGRRAARISPVAALATE